MRSVKVLSSIAAIGAFLVIILGKIVHLTGASTSIPDWPLAFHQLVPVREMTRLVFWEWFHRLSVLIVFITVVVLIVRTFWLPGRLWLYCSISLLLLLIPPAVIGGLAVLGYHLHWTLLVLDHASAMLFYASMVGLAVWSHLAGVKAGRP